MKNKAFKIVSIIFLIGCLIFYGYRFIHYYQIYNANDSDNQEIKQMQLNKKVLTDAYTKKIVKSDGNIKYFSGESKYIKYSGLLWQVISINNKEIKMVTKDSIVYLANDQIFDQSFIKEYLNNTDYNLYKSLESPEAYLVNTEICLDNISDINSLTCNTKQKYKVGLLSLNDYASTGGIDGFLNNDTNFWLTNYDEDSFYYISNANELETTKVVHEYGVRPVVTLNQNILYIGGEGTLDDPYLIGEETSDILNQKLINSYVKFNDQIWKIILQEDIGTKLVLNTVLEDKMIFDNSKTKYNESSIYKYLNNDYYNSIKENEKIVKGHWYIGEYNITNNFDYKKIYQEVVEGYVGLLNITDFYVNEIPNIYTLTRINDYGKSIYVVNDNFEIYADNVNKERNIRPVIYLDSNLKIASGNGSLTDPFVLE